MDYTIQTPAQLATHLRALRKAKGLSQAQLGELLGVDQTRIARIERNPTSISVEQLLKILTTLGVRLVLSPLPTIHGSLTVTLEPVAGNATGTVSSTPPQDHAADRKDEW